MKRNVEATIGKSSRRLIDDRCTQLSVDSLLVGLSCGVMQFTFSTYEIRAMVA